MNNFFSFLLFCFSSVFVLSFCFSAFAFNQKISFSSEKQIISGKRLKSQKPISFIKFFIF